MAGDGAKWDGLLKWSLAHSDGTQPPRNISKEDRRWFMEAMQAQMLDVGKRMKVITLVMKTPEDVLESQGSSPSDIEDLHSIGGLVPLLSYLKNSNAAMQTKAADVVTTIVQNNPKSQQLVMEVSGLEPLLSNFPSDPDIASRTKPLGAISSLARNNMAGIAAFRLANGYAAVRDVLGSENARFQRKALNLIQYLLRENNSDCALSPNKGFLISWCTSQPVRTQPSMKLPSGVSSNLLVIGHPEAKLPWPKKTS